MVEDEEVAAAAVEEVLVKGGGVVRWGRAVGQKGWRSGGQGSK